MKSLKNRSWDLQAQSCLKQGCTFLIISPYCGGPSSMQWKKYERASLSKIKTKRKRGNCSIVTINTSTVNYRSILP
ncbi:hypothetical protein Fmac_006271 [Flemingia macrophylla]|uniref:Uncharacterized protein n=1 Tax=Flemingia macrophylla TaxID=520843 RepID=A0ABD1NAN6_9FABA